jgi:restriction system protein
MVVLQDWSSDAALGQKAIHYDCVCCGYGKKVRTNLKLIELLKRYFSVDLKDIFATNLFPFIKRGTLSARIRFRDLVRAAGEFGIPQIKIVKPRLVVCLGKDTFYAIRCAWRDDEDRIRSLSEAIGNPFQIGRTKIWCQAHTGHWGQINRNKGRRRVSSDWNRMRKWFESGD